ncbi:methionyl-tRNA formyltransferase [Streptomyces sp. NPDC058412]|uniref:methionyl-tRNA formyltransferase n=1 Tax=Streptomyces sp. NPDC058412 TaxID=3346486 RepID=UPI00365DD851
MRIILISYSASGFSVLREACHRAGYEPVVYMHARSLTPNGETRSGAGEVVSGIVDSIPPGMDFFLPGGKENLANVLACYNADLIVCYGFPWRLPASVLQSTRLGGINVHTSMLPQYRGPIPVNWAIRNGDAEIGVSIHWMEEEFDAGGILAQEAGIALEDDVIPEKLWDDVNQVISRLLPVALKRVADGCPGEVQQAGDHMYAGWMEESFHQVDWSNARRTIHNQVRAIRFGSSGKSGPTARVGAGWVRLLRTSLEPTGGIEMECSDGSLWIVDSVPADPPRVTRSSR